MSRLLKHTPDEACTITVNPEVRSSATVPRELYAKFCEHLRTNIYHGMEAQILFNCTMSRYAFSRGGSSLNRPDGGTATESDEGQIRLRAIQYERQFGLHPADDLVRDLADGAAFGWLRMGGVEEVVLSPDVGPYGSRAQRVETFGATSARPLGLVQRRYLPAHRTLGFEYRVVARASEDVLVTLSISQAGRALASEQFNCGDDWRTVTGTLALPDDDTHDRAAPYTISLTLAVDANVVVERVMLYPDDHINGADPDVIAMLRDAQLPLLRWPGGNFVSAYHWRDGVGPIDARPTLPNPAWEGLEFNTFGTDEFMDFCAAVGCAPMICVNGGSGTPEEASAWVEYCNGGVDTPMGALRASNGHPAPYDVRVWEIGNELWGRWQAGWTSGGGYADRYRRFRAAMLKADPTIDVQACADNSGPLWDEGWNRKLMAANGATVETVADHLLTGDTVGNDTDPVDLYKGFMAHATTLEARYAGMADAMRSAGVAEPHVAITELQMFAHHRAQPEPGHRLRPEHLPTPSTIAEALYLHGMINAAIRSQGLIHMITHSATLNHGGGLYKERERVWGGPVHYGHVMGVEMAGGTALAIDLRCPTYDTVSSYGQVPAFRGMAAVEPMAVLSEDGASLYVTLFSRLAAQGLLDITLDPGMSVAPEVEIVTLTGETMYDQNTRDEPQRVAPVTLTATMDGDTLRVSLAPYQLVRLRFEVA